MESPLVLQYNTRFVSSSLSAKNSNVDTFLYLSIITQLIDLLHCLREKDFQSNIQFLNTAFKLVTQNIQIVGKRDVKI